MMKSVLALLLYFPVTVFAQTALDDWYGQWTAHYSGGDSGTCSATISFSTTTQAAVSGICISDFNPQLQNLFSGQVTSNGAIALTAGTSSLGVQFSGILQGTSGSGQWVNSLHGVSGTWTMSKLPAQTTAIIGSGFWSWEVFVPQCNSSQRGTFNLTYANGAYSGTDYTSSKLGFACQNEGPKTCTKTGFFTSAQDLLTASQFQAMANAFSAGCGNENFQSVSFTSPDSVSATVTVIDPGGYSFSLQMTRAAPTPTSYALAVAKSGTGSGSVTSSPAGIDCGASCSAGFSSGAAVSLTATPSTGSFFAGWRGDCIGTGSCSATMDATRKVIATFKLKPFVAATSSNITATSATITARITFDTPNLGKQGAVFLTSWAPVKGLGALGISTAPLSKTMRVTTTGGNPYLAGKINSQQVALGTLLAASDPNAFVLVQLTHSGWKLVVNGELIPYASGVLGDSLAALSILNNTDPTNLLGAQFCLGYGTSAAEMVTAGRMLPVAAIPDSNSTATSSGSCNVTDIVVEFYNTNLDHYFITADSGEAAAIDGGSAGPGWMRTGNSFRSGGSTSVCRFYGSQSPGPNSHFYTVDASECAGLQQLQAGTPDTEKRWNFESLDFVSTPATNQTCPTGTTPVYRAYNNGFARGVDSNHRITSSLTAISEVVTRGWSNEGVVMCAPN